jgi:anti-anti-sigma factor
MGAMAGFEVQVVEGGQVCRLTVTGEIDLAVSAELASAGLACLERADDLVVLDLGQVTFIDSTGIGALVTVRNRAELVGKTLRVASVSDRVAKVLSIAGLAEVFGLDAADTSVIAPAGPPRDDRRSMTA